MSSQYRSYHPGLKLQFADGKLQPDTTRTIPRSTKQRWKGKNIKSFWTPYPISDTLSDGYLLQRLKKENAEEWLNKPGLLWKKLIVQLDIIQSNSMVEAANRMLKYRFLYTKPVADTNELINTLENAVKSYNNIPNGQLYGFTPNEVLAGAIPDRHHFKSQIALGKKQRLTENQDFPCKMVCQT